MPEKSPYRRRGGGPGEPAPQPVPPTPFGFPLLLDSRELADALGIGRTKAYQLMLRGEVPTVRIGRCVRVPQQGLIDWIRTVTTPAVASRFQPR